MNNGDNVTRGRHLEALAGVFLGRLTSVSGAIDDILNSFGVFTGATSVRAGTEGLVPAPAAGDEVKFLCGDGTWSTVESGATVLDTIPATINGGMWYEVVNGTPVVKIYYNGQEYSLGEAEDPNLQVIPSNVTVPHGNVATARVSYDGDGILSLQPTITNATYDSSTRQITVPYSPSIDSSSIQVELEACPGFTPAEASLNVTMEKLDPNLTVTLESSSTVTATSPAIATVYWEGGGEITVTSNPNVPWTYENNTITVPYADIAGSVTFTVHVAPNNGYLEDTKTFNVTMQKLSPNLTVTPSTLNIAVGTSSTASVDYSGSGTVSLSSTNATLTPSLIYSNKTITVPYVVGVGEATVNVNLTASHGYTADQETLAVTMEKLDPNLTITPSSVTVPYGGSATVQATYDGNGDLHVSGSGIRTEYDETTKVITIYHTSNINSAQTITVNLDAASEYASDSATFTVTMVAPETVLTVTPSANLTSGSDITATVSCNSGGTISVVCDNSDIDMTFDGTTITLPFYLFSANTTVVSVTVSVAANGDYPSAETQFAVNYVGGSAVNEIRNSKVYMPFDTSVTEDLCGNTWTTSDTPVIQDNALYLSNHSTVGTTDGITVSTGRFTVRFWLKLTGAKATTNHILSLFQKWYSERSSPYLPSIMLVDYYGGSTPGITLYVRTSVVNNTASWEIPCSRNAWHYLDLRFSSDGGVMFVDGVIAKQVNGNYDLSHWTGSGAPEVSSITFNYVMLGRGDISTQTSNFQGYIDDLIIHDGWRNTPSVLPERSD